MGSSPPPVSDSTPPPDARAAFVASGFFALRTPLLPLQALVDWSQQLRAPQAPPGERQQALAEDRHRLRERLRHWLADPVIREALFIASPVLEQSLPVWQAEPDSERGQKVERTLVRYFSRMAARATPFGLFAGHSVGRIAGHTRLQVAGRTALQRHTRLDMDYLGALVQKAWQAPTVRKELRYIPNSSLYSAAGRVRYLETQVRGRERSYHLVGVEPTPYLASTLERARPGATLRALAEALVAGDPEVSLEEALQYVEELVREQLLVPTWAPAISGPEPVPHLLEAAQGVPALEEVCRPLAATQALLARMDAQPPGHLPSAYLEAARPLQALPAPVELPRLFQVDAFRPAPEASLGASVVGELLRGVQALQRMTPRRRESHPLERLKARFLERYEGRAVPLLEALDEEVGIGAELSRRASRYLLATGAPPESAAERGAGEARHWHLLRRLETLWREGLHTLVLTDEDLAAMQAADPVELPDAFGVLATVVARSAEAVDRGEYRVLLENAHGPSGAVYLGRFCHGDRQLEALVREHLRAEEALRPEATFAEVVHLPQGHLGNVVLRPRLRQHDLLFLGESAASGEERISLEDLWVSVEQGRFVLRSQRLGREVIPRLSTAHQYATHGLAAYVFLGLLQHADWAGLLFSWGPQLGLAFFLPRVEYGRLVLSLAQWKVDGRTLREWGRAQGAERYEAVQLFRARARLPRWVCLSEEDNQLAVDLENALSVEALVQLVKGRPYVTLCELWPGPEELCVEGSEGRYVNEVVVPFVRTSRSVPAAPPPPQVRSSVPRTFPPGSEWLYLKLYGGAPTLDRLLSTSLGEALRKALATGAADRCFLLRYKDPEHHLRLRFHGEPARLESQVWPVLRAACAAAMAEGCAWRVQLDTYEREVERYGGPEGVELAEALFTADSLAVLELLHAYPGGEAAELRWRLTLKGMDLLLEDLGLGLEQRRAVVEQSRAGLAQELRVDKAYEEQLGQRYRREGRLLEALLSADPATPGPARAGLVALARRSARLRPVAQRLREAEHQGRLTSSLEQLAASFLHLHVNRMLAEEQRSQELILHDFLGRLYRSRQARAKKGT